MYDKKLARRILEKLDETFPCKMHLHELRATLPEYKGLAHREWFLAVEALKLEGKLNGKFLKNERSVVAAAELYITERGRLQLQKPADRVATGVTDIILGDVAARVGPSPPELAGRSPGAGAPTGMPEHQERAQSSVPDPFQEDASSRPLGDNPSTPDHVPHERLEEANREAKEAIGRYQLPPTPAATDSGTDGLHLSTGQDELEAPIQWLVYWRQQQQDIAIQKALERLGRQPGWAQTHLKVIQADEDRDRSIASGSASPWRVGLSYYEAAAEAWLGLVTDSQCAQDFYTILPIIVEGVYRQCFGATPEAFRPVSADAHQFQRDLASLDRDFRRRAAEQALTAARSPASMLDKDESSSPAPRSANVGRPRALAINGEKVRKIRGDLKQEDFASRVRMSVDVLQTAEIKGRATEATIRKICRGAKAMGLKLKPEDLKKNVPQKPQK